MVDEFGRTPVEAARDGLLLMISIQERNGFLAPEIAAQVRGFVQTLVEAAAARATGVGEGET